VVNCLLAAPVCHQHLAARRAAQQAQHSGKHGVALWLWCVCVGGGGSGVWVVGRWVAGLRVWSKTPAQQAACAASTKQQRSLNS
jgi:hypothetical protein